MIFGYTASKGIEVIGRVSFILVMIWFLVMACIIGFLAPKVEISNFFPIFDVNKLSFIKGMLLFIGFSSINCFIILGIPRYCFVNQKKYGLAMVLGYIVASLMIILFLFFIIGIFGIDLASAFSYPSYALLRKISAFNFIERVENISSIVIFITYVSSFFIIINFLKEYIKNTFNVKKDKIVKLITIICSIVIPIFSIYFFQREFLGYIYDYFPYFSIFIFLVLLVIFILLMVSKKKIKQS